MFQTAEARRILNVVRIFCVERTVLPAGDCSTRPKTCSTRLRTREIVLSDATFNERAELRLSNLVKFSRILVIGNHSRELIERVCNRVKL